MRLSSLLVCLFIGQWALAAPSYESITMTTFNLKWYGLGGNIWGHSSMEFRKDNIRRFIKEELSRSSIIVFTEIVDNELLADTVKDTMECMGYQRESSRHQHTAICFDKSKYRAEKYDEDYIIPEVDLGRNGQRPATHAKICRKKGKCFLQVLGVHLFAGRETENRKKQIQVIKDNFDRQSRMLPTAILGDFNSYNTTQTGLEKSDMAFFEEILSSKNRRFKTTNKDIPTYNSGERGRVYDHIVVSTNIKVSKTSGYLACANNTNFNKRYIPYYSFKRYFSDHCPMTATLRVPI
ncbi:MAG: hypothetical protein AAF203_03350 [Pseudomonadota bacterium]